MRNVTTQRLSRVLVFWCTALLVSVPGLAIAQESPELSDENAANLEVINVLTAGNIAGLAAGLVAPPPFDKIGEFAEYGTNIGLKYAPGIIEPPETIVVRPAAGSCVYRYHKNSHPPESVIDYENIYGVELNVPSDWGLLDNGTLAVGDELVPDLYHFNTGAWLTIRRNLVNLDGTVERDANGDGLQRILFSDSSDREATVGGDAGELNFEDFPIGSHSLEWEMENKLDLLFDILLDPAIFVAEMKWAAKSKAVLEQQKRFGRVWDDAAIAWAKKFERSFGQELGVKIAQKLALLGIELAVDAVDLENFTEVPTGIINRRNQTLRVLDEVPPSISLTAQPGPFEATTLGGTFGAQHFAELRELVLASDNCDRPVILDSEPIGTRFWPTGVTTTLQWCGRDLGPTSATGGTNRSCTDININVEDTLPPLVLPPKAINVIASSEQTFLPGKPGVFDLADPEVVVTNDAPATFPVGRTEVTWTATDSGGNSASASQWVSVKQSNTAPTAISPPIVQATSFEQTRIELSAQDVDLLDGRYDQLGFRVVDSPDDGFFVAPLFPFFIEDFRRHRINPDGTYASFGTQAQAACEDFGEIPRVDLILEPSYIDVRDDGTVYVVDQYKTCSPGSGTFNTRNRIAKFVPDANEELEYVSQYATGTSAPDSFTIDHLGRLWVVNKPGSRLNVLDADLNVVESYSFNDFTRINPVTGTRQVAFDNSNSAIRSVVVDKNDVIYVTDGSQLRAYDLQERVTDDVDYGGEYLKPVFASAFLPNSVGQTQEPFISYGDFVTGGYADLAIDSEGNVYASDEPSDRIWKFQATRFGESRDILEQAPEFVGWMGKCTSNLDPTVLACDVDLQRSIGFSCEDDLCGVTAAGDDGLGQFSRPRGIAMSPTDILYVTDTDNFRVQRFTTDGFFAGVATSECNGSCFVLGDFGLVTDISVNSNFFYLLDPEQDFTHIFETTPITDIDDQSLEQTQHAFITYQSNNNFRGTDSFGFIAFDGLEDSNVATVTVDVERNFRPPVATKGLEVMTAEDTSVEFDLTGLDPDEDELVYVITTPPSHGTVVEVNGRFEYTPDTNFFGEDRFEFVASDAPTSTPALVSEPEEVLVSVSAVNDEPQIMLSAELKAEAGAYYPYQLAFYVKDGDRDDRHRIAIEWGDGRVMASDDDDLHVGSGENMARVITQHQLEGNAGDVLTHTICVSDVMSDQPLTCESADVTATATFSTTLRNMVDLVVNVTDSLPKYEDTVIEDQLLSRPLLDGDDQVVYSILVTNNPPGDESTPLATGVSVEIDFPEEMTLLATEPDRGSCIRVDTRISCGLGNLAAEEQAQINLTLSGDGRQLEDTIATLLATAKANEEDPDGEDNTASLQTELLYNELLDADDDGVANMDDAFPGDATESVDTDGDGSGNNADTDDDNDAMPDVFEQRYGFDALSSADGALDADGDGVSNVAEFLAQTRPDTGDSDLDGVSDGDDNCPLNLNFNQFDQDGDLLGDVCDAGGFATAVALGDLNGNGFSDVALLRTVNGTINVYIKDSEDDVSIGADQIALGSSAALTPVSLFALPSTQGFSNLGVLMRAGNGSSQVTVVNPSTGATVYTVPVFNSDWKAIEATVSEAGTLVVAQHVQSGEVAVERRELSSGVLIGTTSFGSGLIPRGVAMSVDGVRLVLLAERQTTGDIDVIVRDAVTEVLTDQWTVGDSATLLSSLAGTLDGVMVVTQDLSGNTQASVLRYGQNNPQTTFVPLASGQTLAGVRVLADQSSVAVLSAVATVGSRVTVLALDTGEELNQFDLQDSTQTPRGLVELNQSSTTELGASATSADGSLSVLLLNSSDGSGARTLKAESAAPVPITPPVTPPTTPPPTTPPTTPPSPPSTGGGGGGAVGMGAMVWLLLAAALRRQRVPMLRTTR